MTATPTPDQLTFLAWHKPSIAAGEYTIQVKQTLVADDIPANDPRFATPVMSFSVQGERFSLPPTEVHAVFPPDASTGDHANVLPHVVLRRSTLPWERRADAKDDTIPWLALLVFHDGEVFEPPPMKLSEAGNGALFPAYADELKSGRITDDTVAVIDVERELLKQILPSVTELEMLTHVRKRGETELAVVIAKRLPKRGGFSTAHLVSLEGRFKNRSFDFMGAEAGDKVRLISLASFRFGCIDPKRSFTSLLRGLGGALETDASKPESVSTLRLPDALYPHADELAKAQLSKGSVPMRHTRRNGEATVSWYHGPLAPARTSPPATAQPAAQTSDELLRYSPQTGMFDVSYAAAWEVGRLLALQNTKFSVELHHWKQERAKLRQLTENPNAHPLVSPGAHPLVNLGLPFPEQLRAWLDDLSLLEGVPFSYLVPDERMLPLESIRIFWLDRLWVECLLDGAFSIGRHTNADATRDAEHRTNGHYANPHPLVTGLILRSEVVSGWPGLQVDGYDHNHSPLKALRTQRLSPSVLVCLFEGEIGEVKIHQKVETLHFGVEAKGDRLVKTLRKGVSTTADVTPEGPKLASLSVNVALKEPKERRIIDLDSLTQAVGASTSAEFARQMIEGVEEVTFLITTPPAV